MKNLIKNRVVILTAGQGSRLKERTRYINKSLLRVGNKAVISHIIDNFPKETEFVIALGYMGDIVKQYLNIVYPDRSFIFVKVDKYEGKGTGPGYSLNCCKEHLQQPFYYWNCDAIVKHFDITSFGWNGYSFIKKYQIKNFCTFSLKELKVDEIYNKDKNGTDRAFIGISFVDDYIQFWDLFEQNKCENKKTKEIELAPLFLSLDNMGIRRFDWLDTGSEEGLKKARSQFKGQKTLDKLDEEIYFFKDEGFVVKYFYNENMVSGRLERAKEMGEMTPKILDSSKNFYKYEYIEGNDLFEESDVDSIFPSLLETTKQKIWQPKKQTRTEKIIFNGSCKRFYYDKTMARVNKLFDERKYIKDTEQEINNIFVPKIEKVFNEINWDYISKGIPCIGHGDFVFGNILYTKEGDFKLIDFRQDFSGLIDSFDIYYDFAKLYAGFLFPLSSVRNNKFYVDVGGITNKVKAFIETPVEIEKCKDYFIGWLLSENYDIMKVKILASLVLINMAPLHENPLDEWLFYFGKYKLWQILIKNKGD